MMSARSEEAPSGQQRSHGPAGEVVRLGGRYELGRCIGRGGMGLVFEARHVLLERRVAVKLLRPKFAQNPAWVERFRREARAASAIGHENIVDILDIGVTDDGSPYYVMEFLEGETLAALARREAPLPWRRVRGIALQLCDALAAAHRAGVIHRDLKPANCIRLPRARDPDFVKILDFGIAKLLAPVDRSPRLTSTGEVFGTPGYMAPEQLCGGQVDARADLYAVAVLVYQLLTGRLPFTGETPEALVHQQFVATPPEIRRVAPACDVPDAVERALRDALRQDPGLRPASMEAFAALLGPVPRSARALEEKTTVPRFVRPSPESPQARWATLSVGLGGVSAASLAVWFGVMVRAAPIADGQRAPVEPVESRAPLEAPDIVVMAPPVVHDDPRPEPEVGEPYGPPPPTEQAPGPRPTGSAAISLAQVVEARWPSIERCLCERLDGIPPTTLGLRVRADGQHSLSVAALGTNRGSEEVRSCLERGFARPPRKLASTGERSVEVTKQPRCSARRDR